MAVSGEDNNPTYPPPVFKKSADLRYDSFCRGQIDSTFRAGKVTQHIHNHQSTSVVLQYQIRMRTSVRPYQIKPFGEFLSDVLRRNERFSVHESSYILDKGEQAREQQPSGEIDSYFKFPSLNLNR